MKKLPSNLSQNNWVENRCGRQTLSVWCVLCAQSSPISSEEEEEGKKQMPGLPASHSYAPRNGKSVYIVWSVCVCMGPSTPPPPPPAIPPSRLWDGNYFHETKVAPIILPDAIPAEGQQRLLHANGSGTH